MATRRLGLILSGVTGRIGVNQHLGNAVAKFRETPITLANGDQLELDPILVGRNADKLEQIARRFNIERWTTDLDAALSDQNDTVFFDSAVTGLRFRLELDGVDYAWGTSRQAVSLPVGGEALFTVTVPGSLPEARPGRDQLPYNLAGTLLLDDNPGEARFVHAGSLGRRVEDP